MLNDMFTSPLVGGRPRAFVPPTDVAVSEGDVVVTMDVPGLAADSLEIELVGDELLIRGERRAVPVGEGATWVHAERSTGRFERRIRVPAGVDADRIAATLDAGVLSLIVPKPERLRPRRIEIETGEARQLETAGA